MAGLDASTNKPRDDRPIWAILLHLGYNMFADNDKHGSPQTNISVKPYLRCDRSLWDDLVQAIAQSGMNMLVIDLGEGVRYESHPELGVEGSWSVGQIREEVAKLKSLGIEPIPKMNFSTAHDIWLGPYSRMVSSAPYYEVCADLIAEACDLFDSPRLFHLGMDEEDCRHQWDQQYLVVRQNDLWWHDLNFYVKEAEKGGARPWIWSDYVWRHPEDFFAKMPKSVVQGNWYYEKQFEGSENPAVAAYLNLDAHGYDQIPTGSNWGVDDNFENTVRFCREHIAPERLLGFLTAPWKATLEEARDHHLRAIAQVKNVIDAT